eukprot:Phypoly_transcript_00559.p1 GENE.Phypoly_transcript_00559~~Phypoly_transcript_00559.p1  ORF type:complete len:1075 (-),score=176.29 Phypoly_transcript_00559:1265-4462(-)
MADKSAEASAGSKITIKLDSKSFWRRVKALYDSWQKKDDYLWKGPDALVIAQGTPDDDNPYKKTNALQYWLLGYEFADTIIVFCESNIYVLTSPKKIGLLEVLKEENAPYVLCFLQLSKAENNQNLNTLFEAVHKSKSGKSIGVLPKEKMQGALGSLWEEALAKSGLTLVDVAPGYSEMLSVKDTVEMKLLKQAAETTSKVMSNFLIPAVETVIDEGTQKSHTALAEEMEEVFAQPEKINSKLVGEHVESCYIPIIQSGGKYDLKLSATNDNENLHFGTIVCALGARYKGYCSNAARTFFIDPKKEVEINYRFLLEVHNIVVKSIKPGVKISVIMDKATKYIADKRPELSSSFLKCCGYGIGIEFQETYLMLSSKNTRTIKPGMAFNIMVGFQNLELKEEPKDPKNKVYSMLLADTVIVSETGEAEVLTNSVSKRFGDVSYFIEELDNEEKALPTTTKKSSATVKSEKAEKLDDAFKSATFDGPRSRDQKGKSKGSEDKIKKHQEELAEKLARDRRKGADEDSTSAGPSTVKPSSKDIVAYPDTSAYPHEAHRNKILVDHKAEAILLPIYGYLVPFHISIVKNASKTDDYLRINFVTPTQVIAQSQGQGKELLYIREVTYRIQDQRNLTNSLLLIKQLRKQVSEREAEQRNVTGLVSQDKLIVSKNPRNPKLMGLFIRPNISGHRTGGTLEAHTNGFRFSTSKGTTVDILFKNIKHAFFQPCDHEQIVLVHFHLHNYIMIGKKKAKDVQFCTEVMEGSSHLDGTSRSSSRDEIEDEQAEAEMRNKLNRDFQTFVKRVEEVSAQSGTEIEFDIPFRELGFFGVPSRSNVFLQPSVHCLVSLIEPPFFVLTLKEIEICNFERVSFGLRNFDMVFVFKDYERPVTKVNNIPVDSLEAIKEWLDECNIKFYEGPTNLNWTHIMGTVRQDVDQFFEDGGWSFLEDKDSDAGDSSSEDGSEFEPESSGSGEEEEASEDDYSSDSDASGSDYSSASDEESEEEGLDWEELERKAAAEDRAKKYDEDEPPKRKRAGGAYSDDEDDHPKSKKPAVSKGDSLSRNGSSEWCQRHH